MALTYGYSYSYQRQLGKVTLNNTDHREKPSMLFFNGIEIMEILRLIEEAAC